MNLFARSALFLSLGKAPFPPLVRAVTLDIIVVSIHFLPTGLGGGGVDKKNTTFFFHNRSGQVFINSNSMMREGGEGGPIEAA